MSFVRALLIAFWTVPLSVAASAADATWHVIEGTDARSTAVWHIRIDQGQVAGNATMLDRGRSVKFGIVGTRTGSVFALQRSGASDGSHCAYKGRLDAATKRITGTALCGSAASAWTAVPQGK